MFRKLFSTLLVTLFFSTACHAGLVLYDNQIWGVTDINVDGRLYDFEYLDGSCTFRFNGCDEPSDFTFNTFEKAQAASQALIDALGEEYFQLGLGGCGFSCRVLTPYDSSFSPSDPMRIAYFAAINFRPEYSNGYIIDSGSYYADFNIVYRFEGVWAFWTPKGYVPEPGTAILMLLGLVGLSLCQSRKKL